MIILVLREKHENQVLNHAKLEKSDCLLHISSRLPHSLEIIQLLYCEYILVKIVFFLFELLWMSLKKSFVCNLGKVNESPPSTELVNNRAASRILGSSQSPLYLSLCPHQPIAIALPIPASIYGGMKWWLIFLVNLIGP